MRGNEAMVNDALGKLGVDQADLDRAAGFELHEFLFLSTDHAENEVAHLGSPPTPQTIQSALLDIADGGSSMSVTCELPLWPGLVFSLEGWPGVPVFRKFDFSRSPQVPPVLPDGFADLRPWAWVRDEIIERFGPPIKDGDIWPPFEEYKFQTRDSDGRTRSFWAVFSWSLLQHVEWDTDQPDLAATSP
ncbi:hypothetical protein [Actinomadura sp. 6N118]|uniref:hypothetical protein n=1 Tax=Actinomadura sp. 6N118 TaxID=3375151 RepID=UPI00379F9BE1